MIPSRHTKCFSRFGRFFFALTLFFFGCEMKREGKSEKERKNTSPKETVEKKKQTK